MTPELLAFVLMPGAMIGVALAGYAIFLVTDPRRRQSPRYPAGSPVADQKSQ